MPRQEESRCDEEVGNGYSRHAVCNSLENEPFSRPRESVCPTGDMADHDEHGAEEPHVLHFAACGGRDGFFHARISWKGRKRERNGFIPAARPCRTSNAFSMFRKGFLPAATGFPARDCRDCVDARRPTAAPRRDTPYPPRKKEHSSRLARTSDRAASPGRLAMGPCCGISHTTVISLHTKWGPQPAHACGQATRRRRDRQCLRPIRQRRRGALPSPREGERVRPPG